MVQPAIAGLGGIDLIAERHVDLRHQAPAVLDERDILNLDERRRTWTRSTVTAVGLLVAGGAVSKGPFAVTVVIERVGPGITRGRACN